MDDEHRFDWFGFAGHPFVRTPHLDALAAKGVVFENAYTPSPACIPARQCLATGQYPRDCGVERFGEDLPPGSETFARVLSRVGYDTVCAGKLHHHGPDQMQGWNRRICTGDDLQVDLGHRTDLDAAACARNVPPVNMWSLAEELRRAGAGKSPYANSDRLNVEGACAFLEEYFVSPFYERATPDRPLMLTVSLQQPHYPFCAPAERVEAYLPLVTEYENQACLEHPAFRNWTWNPEGVSREQRLRALAATAAMVEICDEHFGRVLDCIRACGQDPDDWLIVYTSDHGDLLGEHGKWWKLSFYEASVKVPMVACAPRLFSGGRRLPEHVNLCDLFATFCEAAGTPVPGGTRSRSLMPLLRGDATEWQDETVSQYEGRCLMIKQGSLKYQWYGPQQEEVLFDLAVDPGETRNVAKDPDYQEKMAEFRVSKTRYFDRA